MLKYKRNITVWLIILRVLLLSATAAIMFFILEKQTTAAIIVAIVVLLMAFIKVRSIHVYTDHFIVQEYYVYAVKYREWLINKSHRGMVQWFRNGDINVVPDMDTGTAADLLMIPLSIFALGYSNKEGIRIHGLAVHGKKRKPLRISLSPKEMKFVNDTGII